MTIRVNIHITGTVQGVGFRPTVYKHAIEHQITGSVSNTAQGVIITAQGKQGNVTKFVDKIKNDPPPQAKIVAFYLKELSSLGNEKSFTIIASQSLGEKNVHISADIATCKECRDEIFNPSNRRFRYPFTNCTNCGPRFSIINDRPYDRKLTSMNDFQMCPECQAEYENPLSRRFHAQPNACHKCGPQLHLLGINSAPSTLDEAIKQIQKGKLAAIKGIGGFNICCDPFNHQSITKLRKVKKRPHKSFAVMIRDLNTIREFCKINAEEESWLTHAAAPIVLLKKYSNALDYLSPDNNYLGVMLPYTPLHHLLMQSFPILVMTSANLADEPIAINDQSVSALIKAGTVDFALSNNREIIHRADDSILQVIDGKVQMIRRSRGFTPVAFFVEKTDRSSSLALGANMKNSFALAKGKEIYLSQHIGELIDHRNYQYQKEQIEHFANLLEIKPTAVHGDAHPGYENYSKVETRIYHHHAHLLSVMGEHNLLGQEVLGVIADGTGFGTDETIWGFEFLKIDDDHRKFERVANLSTFALPGGEMALKEIDRVAIALGSTRIKNPKIKMLIDHNLNCPKTSSLGRLFDGVAAILEVCQNAEYEARGAIILQKHAEAASRCDHTPYDITINNGIIDYTSLIMAIENDLDHGQTNEVIAYKFHQWVVNCIVKVITMNDAKVVAFSGGCFQNKLLVELLNQEIIKLPGKFYFNERIPTNDGGIAFGQALI